MVASPSTHVFRRVIRALAITSLVVYWFGTACGAHAAPATLIDNIAITKTIGGNTTTDPNGHLPYHWDKRNGAVDGQARFVTEVSVVDTSQPLALYIPRLGNTYVISVNGHELDRYGTLPPDLYDDAANVPRYFTVPADWLAPHTVIDITIGAIGGRGGGLSTFTIGLASEVHGPYALEYLLEVSGRLVLVVVTTVLGALALLMWMRQRDPAYLYYAMAELLWALLTSRTLFSTSLLPWPWWGYLSQMALVLAVPLQCKFALVVVDRDRGWLRHWTMGMLVLAIPVIVVNSLLPNKWLYPAWRGLMALNAVAMAWTVIAANRDSKATEHKVLGVAVVLVGVAAVRDVLTSFSPNIFYFVSWTRYAWTGLGISFAWVIAERMRRASIALTSMNAHLSDQLAVQSKELTENYARERVRDVEHGALLERQRLTRDLHDGLGGHLAAVLRMTQHASASKEDVATQLRMAVDQLKITVDAMQETDGDIPSLLGAVRYRLTRRLNAADINLQWDVAHLPVIENWGVRQSYELQMVLFEIFTNMMVHSDASQASLSARQMPYAGKDCIGIQITDNGKGFDLNGADGSRGRGIANMKMRAITLGAELSIDSRPGETRTTIMLSGAITPIPSP